MKKIFSFLFLASGISYFALMIPQYVEIESLWAMLLVILLYMWGPGIAAWMIHKVVHGGKMQTLGFRSGRMDIKWLLAATVAPLGILAGLLGVVFLMGNVLSTPGFGQVVLSGAGIEGGFGTRTSPYRSKSSGINALLFDKLSLLADMMGSLMEGEKLGTFFLMLLIGLVFGITLNLVFTLGQEIGWRGFMLRQTQHLGFEGSNLVTGLTWGAWAIAPAVLMGYWDLFPLTLAVSSCIAMSFISSWLSLKCGSVFASAAFHGVLGATGGLGMMLIEGGDPLISGVGGVAGIIVFMGVAWLILTRDRSFVASYEDLRYTPEEDPNGEL